MGTKRVMSQAAKIGQVAHETGVSIDAIRFYEKQGLLRRSARTGGGFRLFGSDEIQTLRFVRKAQDLGFSLERDSGAADRATGPGPGVLTCQRSPRQRVVVG